MVLSVRKNYVAKERLPHRKMKPRPPSNQCIMPASGTLEPVITHLDLKRNGKTFPCVDETFKLIVFRNIDLYKSQLNFS